MDVRPQLPADDGAVRDVVTRAFDDDGRVAGLVEALRARTDAQASLVGVVDGEVVGHTHLSLSWVDAPERLVPVLTLSPLSVLPAHQNRGVGTELLARARDAAVALAAPLVFLEGDPAYYARHGWRPAGELGFTAPSVRVPAPAFQVLTLPGYDPARMRGALVYNDTFWSFDCVGLRATDGAAQNS